MIVIELLIDEMKKENAKKQQNKKRTLRTQAETARSVFFSLLPQRFLLPTDQIIEIIIMTFYFFEQNIVSVLHILQYETCKENCIW